MTTRAQQVQETKKDALAEDIPPSKAPIEESNDHALQDSGAPKDYLTGDMSVLSDLTDDEEEEKPKPKAKKAPAKKVEKAAPKKKASKKKAESEESGEDFAEELANVSGDEDEEEEEPAPKKRKVRAHMS